MEDIILEVEFYIYIKNKQNSVKIRLANGDRQSASALPYKSC